MKYPFYQLYTYWTIALFLLYISNIIHFSVVPSLIGAFIGTIFFFIYKYKRSKKINYNLGIVLLFLHLTPLFIVPLKFTFKDFIYNALVFILYLLSLALQNTNPAQVYRKLIDGQRGDISVLGHFKEIF